MEKNIEDAKEYLLSTNPTNETQEIHRVQNLKNECCGEEGELLEKDKLFFYEKSNNFRQAQEKENKRIIAKLSKVCIFSFTFFVIELVGGYIAGSLAIMTDAAHLLSDLSGFLISIVSLYIAMKPANATMTYGYHRAEVLGSLASILIIWVLTAWLVIEAVERLFNPQPIKAVLMLVIACIGLSFNLIMARILMNDDELVNKFEEGSSVGGVDIDKEINKPDVELNDVVDGLTIKIVDQTENHPEVTSQTPAVGKDDDNLILKATYIHILGDILQSLGVVIAATIIYFMEASHPMIVKVDPICTFIFAIIVLKTSIPVSMDCFRVLMEASPETIHQAELIEEFKNIPNVVDFHDIHIWNLSTGKPALTAHFISNNPQKTLELATEISKKFGIFHTTIQVEDYTQRRRGSFKVCTHINDNMIH